MAITYLSGERIQGLSSEKASLLAGAFGSDVTRHENSNTGATYHIATSTSYAANGVFVDSSESDALVGAEIQSVSFYLKGESLTGTITCSAYNADGCLIGNIGTYDISGLTTSWQKITFTGTTQVLPKDGFLQFHGFGSSVIKINGNAAASSDMVYTACRTVSLNGTPLTNLGDGANCEIVYKPAVPILPLQTQYESTDTRKQYSLLYTTSGGSIGWVEMGTGGFLS